MLDYTLPAKKLAELGAAHRNTRDKREADHIKTVVLLATGSTVEQTAEVLQADPNTIRSRFKCYRQGGIEKLVRVALRGSKCALDKGQLASLDVHLQTHLYVTAEAVVRWVEETYKVSYTESDNQLGERVEDGIDPQAREQVGAFVETIAQRLE